MYFDFIQLNYLLMYFIYGLAFFSMGLAMALEAGRSPNIAEANLLKPLAVFGILNAIHQWLEIVILQGIWLDFATPKPFIILKLSFLTISYASLTAFGVQAFRPARRQVAASIYVSLGFIAFYIIAVLINHILPWQTTPNCLKCADALARYTLALPGALLAALALRNHALTTRGRNQALSRSFWLAAWGFGLYGFTQIFTYEAEIYPAAVINSEVFQNMTGIPIQLVRTVLAIFTMGNLIRASQLAEKERHQELLDAQQEKLAALEQVQEELLKRRELRRNLLRHIVLAQEEERSRISRELHDDTAQILTAASLNMAALKNEISSNPKVLTLIERTQDLCSEMSQALYRMVHALRPAQLDDFGLVATLQHLTQEKWFSRKLKINFTVIGEQKRLDPVVETVLFRVAQEALTNALRHANTDKAELAITFAENTVTLTIADQGKGFDPASKGKGFGLAGIAERVELVSGTLNVTSAPGKGTTVQVIAPVRLTILQEQPEQEIGPCPHAAMTEDDEK